MRGFGIPTGLLLVLLSTSCGPTEKDITDSLEASLRSVAGEWTGISTGQNPIRLEFRLQEGRDGQVNGSGTMKEERAASAVPITISGTFRRPALSLTFDGIVYEGQRVQGVAQGDYTSVGGIATTMQLNGSSYSRGVAILLQEK